MIKLTVTLKYRDETLVYFFSFIILFIWLFFFFPKQTFFSLFPCFWRKQTKRFERAKRDLDQAKNPTGPPGWKLHLFIFCLTCLRIQRQTNVVSWFARFQKVARQFQLNFLPHHWVKGACHDSYSWVTRIV